MPIVSKDYFPSTTAQFITEVDNLPPSATYEAKALTKVDVVFAFGEMSQSQQMQDYMDSFEQRLGSAGNNIDAYVQKVETVTGGFNSEDADAETIYNFWDQYPNPNNFVVRGNWIGNAARSWEDFPEGGRTPNAIFNHIFIESNSYKVSDFSISSLYAWHGCELPSGYIFHWDVHADEAYLVIAGNETVLMKLSDVSYYLGVPGSGGNIYDRLFENNGGDSGYEGEILARAPIGWPTSKTYASELRVEMYGNNIKVYNNNNVIIDYIDNNSIREGGIGLFAGCTAAFSNVQLSYDMTTRKSLGESIQDVAWRDNSVRFVIYGEDNIPDWMQNTTNADYQYTVTKLLNSNAYLIPFGVATNQHYMQQLISSISTPQETKGQFINNIPIITAMNSACDWIISLVRDNSKPTQWILVNTPVAWNTIYKDSEHDLPLNFGEHDGQGESLSDKSDTSDLTLASSWGVGLSHYFSNQDKILAEKWRYIHHYTFYDNSTREETFSNVWLSDPVEIFPEPGLYRINYKRKDNPFYTDVNLANPFDEYRYWSTDYDPIIE